MPKRTLSFAAYSDTGASVAWGPANSNPAFPSGYTLGGDPARIASGRFGKFSGSGNTVILDDTVLTGNVIAVEAILGPVTSDSQCLVLCNPSGTGYQFLINSTNIRCFAMTNFVLGAQVGLPIAFVATGGHTARVARNNTNGDMVVSTGVNAANQTTRGTINQANVNTDWRAGVAARNSASIASLVSDYTAAQSINTFTDPLVSGAEFSGTCTGFTDGAATLSSNGLSVAVTVASGAFSGTWPIAVDAQPYPTLPKTAQTITLTQGGDTATISSDLEQAAGQFIVNFVSPITDDDTYPAYYINQDGFTAEGGQFVGMPYSDLVMDADSGVTVTGEGDLVGYFRPATGTGAGNAYYYTFHIIDGSVVSAERGITAVGLSMTGITLHGITAVGL